MDSVLHHLAAAMQHLEDKEPLEAWGHIWNAHYQCQLIKIYFEKLRIEFDA